MERKSYVFLRCRIDDKKEKLFFERVQEIEGKNPSSLNPFYLHEANKSTVHLRDNFFIYKGTIFTGLIWTCTADFPIPLMEMVENAFRAIVHV